MTTPARIACAVVNHNTSHFVELLVRTLLLTNDFGDLDLRLTVLDNRSDDDHVSDLTAYLRAHDISFVQTGFDAAIAVEKHGAALEAFVRQHTDSVYYLFLDADMWFVEPNTIPWMLAELAAAAPDVFANQAQIAGYYAGRIIEGAQQVPGASDNQTLPDWETVVNGRIYPTCSASRCSPVCSLVKNTPLFHTAVSSVGLTPVIRLHVGRAIYYDTFSAMTHVMQTHRQRFIVSAKTVKHFTQATYLSEHRAPKDRDCWLMLNDLRAGRGMQRDIFYESDWVKQQRQQA